MKIRSVSLSLITLTLVLALSQLGQVPVAAAAEPGSAAAARCGSTSLDQSLGDVIAASLLITRYTFLPMIWKDALNCTTGSSYVSGLVYRGEAAPIIPASIHPDKNLAIRSYINSNTQVSGPTGQSGDYNTEGPRAPKLNGLFSPPRLPSPCYLYQVYGWNWDHSIPSHGTRSTPLAAGTIVFVPSTRGELIGVPSSAYDIGAGMEVIVLYADASRITIRYGRDDTGGTVPNSGGFQHPGVGGYVIHIEGICVDPNLVALYQSLDQNGTGPRYNNTSFNLPTLATGQPMGVASGSTIGVAVRDSGEFTLTQMKDWWLLP